MPVCISSEAKGKGKDEAYITSICSRRCILVGLGRIDRLPANSSGHDLARHEQHEHRFCQIQSWRQNHGQAYAVGRATHRRKEFEPARESRERSWNCPILLPLPELGWHFVSIVSSRMGRNFQLASACERWLRCKTFSMPSFRLALSMSTAHPAVTGPPYRSVAQPSTEEMELYDLRWILLAGPPTLALSRPNSCLLQN